MVLTMQMVDGGGSGTGPSIEMVVNSAGVTIPIYSSEDLRLIRLAFEKTVERAIELDTNEANAAASEVRGCLWDKGWDETATRAGWNNLIDVLNGHKNRIHAAMEPFIEQADGPTKIVDGPRKGWDDIVTRLNDIETRVGNLTIDEWQSDGAKAYRQTIPKQQNNVAQVRALADNAGRSIESVAVLQASLSQEVATQVRSANSRAGWPTYDLAATHAYFRRQAENQGNQRQFSEKFYPRTVLMIPKAGRLAAHLEFLLDPGAGWGTSASEIAKQLDTARKQTEAGMVATIGQFDNQVDLTEQQTVDNYGLDPDDQSMK